MAGRGKRFADAGYAKPKPLIDVRGRPMYAWAVDGLPLKLARRLIFLCLEEHLADGLLERDINARYFNLRPMTVPVREVTQGQACTVLLARELINNDDPLLIYNADTYCPTTLGRMIASDGECDGILDVFLAPGDKWSFARLDDQRRVLETAEKKRISEWASTGLYWFRRGRDFVTHADTMIRDNDQSNNEFYVAPVYNRLIAAGLRVCANVVNEIWVLGTPEDLANFERNYRG
jgi:NDP-sugar pyrophosphorylase family protein